jgi:hypothetical protein
MDELQGFNDVQMAVFDEVISLKGMIIANHRAAGQVASGRTIRSMLVQMQSKGRSSSEITLTGRPFFGVLETGSKPWQGQYPHAPAWFRQIIAKWAQDKGIVTDPKEVSRFSWFVSNRIMREGSKLYRTGGREDIYSNAIDLAMERINKISNNIISAQVGQIIATHVGDRRHEDA